MADATLNHTVAEVFAEDTEQLNRMVKLWTDAFKGAAMSEVQSIAKENTDTESSGDVKYSRAEIKNALTKEEYKRATAAFMNDDTSAIIEDCAIRVTNKNDVYKIKIVCYNLFDDEFDFQITEVYQIENTESKLKFSLPETDSKVNKLTEQQREYFKDSKVVQICQQQACTVSYLYHFIKKRLPELFR